MVPGTAVLPFYFPRRNQRPARRLASGFGASIGLHGAAALLLWILTALGWLQGSKVPVKRAVDLKTVSSTDWDRNRRVGATPVPRSKASPSRPRESQQDKLHPEPLPNGQVVDVAAGNNRKPSDAKYLAEHDNQVDKETRAREQTAFYGKAMPRQTTNQDTPKKAKADETRLHGNQGTGTDDGMKKDKTQVAASEIPTAEAQKKVAMLEQAKDGEIKTAPESQRSSGNSYRLRLRPPWMVGAVDNPGSEGHAGSPDAPKDAAADAPKSDQVGAAANDDLSDVDVGDATFLNTREFKYASFFNRVKQAVGEAWNPNGAMRRNDWDGRHGGRLSRPTLVTVTLDAEGHLKKVAVAVSCGVEFLDDEAVAAFERAQPFLYPPEGLLDRDGLIHFKFGFHIDTSPAAFGNAFRVPPRSGP